MYIYCIYIYINMYSCQVRLPSASWHSHYSLQRSRPLRSVWTKTPGWQRISLVWTLEQTMQAPMAASDMEELKKEMVGFWVEKVGLTNTNRDLIHQLEDLSRFREIPVGFITMQELVSLWSDRSRQTNDCRAPLWRNIWVWYKKSQDLMHQDIPYGKLT